MLYAETSLVVSMDRGGGRIHRDSMGCTILHAGKVSKGSDIIFSYKLAEDSLAPPTCPPNSNGRTTGASGIEGSLDSSEPV